MIKATRVGNTIVVFLEGKMYQKTIEGIEQREGIWEQILNTDENDKDDILKLKEVLAPKETQEEIKAKKEYEIAKKEKEENDALIEWMEKSGEINDPLFEVRDNSVYMKGINISMPEILVKRIVQFRKNNDDKNMDSLVNFWRLCALNPNPRSRHDAFSYIEKNNLIITPLGLLVTFRRVDIQENGDREFNEFVSNSYFKVKKWKKSTSNYFIYEIPQDDEFTEERYFITNGDIPEKYNDKKPILIGSVQELYNKMLKEGEKTETVYQANHRNNTTFYINGEEKTGRVEYYVGKETRVPRTDCDENPEQACSRGLHTGTEDFVSSGSFGTQKMAVLVNPADIVSVPYSDAHKMRVSALYPVAVLSQEEINEFEANNFESFEVDYSEYLENMLHNIYMKIQDNQVFEEYKKYEIIPKEIDLNSFINIHDKHSITLDKMIEAIQSRSVDLYKEEL